MPDEICAVNLIILHRNDLFVSLYVGKVKLFHIACLSPEHQFFYKNISCVLCTFCTAGQNTVRRVSQTFQIDTKGSSIAPALWGQSTFKITSVLLLPVRSGMPDQI